MKAMIIIVILLTLVIGMGIFFQSMLVNESREIIANLQNVAQLIREGKWGKADTKLQQINNHWKHCRKKWQAVSNHTEIGYIDESLAKLRIYLMVQEEKDCLAEIAALQQNIRYIPDKEKLTLSNIF